MVYSTFNEIQSDYVGFGPALGSVVAGIAGGRGPLGLGLIGIAKALIRARTAARMTQEGLARRLGVKPQHGRSLLASHAGIIVFLDVDYVEQRYPAGLIEGRQQIDIGIGAVVTPHRRAE